MNVCYSFFFEIFWLFMFWGQKFQWDISTELPCLADLENLGQLPSDSRVTQRYWWLYLMDFWNVFTIYVVKVRKSIADIPTELRCLSDLGNASQLPVWEVLVIVSFRVLKFRPSLCFWGQGSFCWHSHYVWGHQTFRFSSSSRGFRVYQNIRSSTKML